MPNPPETHYVAHIKIERVTKLVPMGQGLGTESKRLVEDVTQMTIKGRDLDNIKSRVAAHIDLMEDD